MKEKVQVLFTKGCSGTEGSTIDIDYSSDRHNSDEIKEGLSFSICKRIVQMMKGNIWISPNPVEFAQSMTLVLRGIFAVGNVLDQQQQRSNSQLRGLRVILADDDGVNRTVTKKLLEKLGCHVLAISSGFECLTAVTSAENACRVKK
ncbi:hypothetical protein F8388_005453 [Cannabis sativa]|uniref:Response regulatory domain-containing protein n=1 Tax=Cannabis sativa TaxID=3483 RepID=A0A7J6DY78_CANSA|nr:hypothetical protein F8388_005453 [Cannabis sativa]KAF4377327.1 hypothetical protein G4B88_011162 [Cannabis sativa]